MIIVECLAFWHAVRAWGAVTSQDRAIKVIKPRRHVVFTIRLRRFRRNDQTE